MNEHILDSDLLLAYTEIMAATRPQDVFGSPAKHLSTSQQERAVHQTFTSLLHTVEPKQYTRLIDVNAAADAKEVLLNLYQSALAEFNIESTLMDFVIRNIRYQIKKWIAYERNATLYLTIATKEDEAKEVVLKIAKNEAGSASLANEAQYLRSFHTTHQNNPVVKIRKTLPSLLDSFNVEGRLVNVLPYYHGYKSVDTIINHFHHELPVGQAAWIARRMLAFPLTAAIAGIEHKAMTFEHLLVHPITHEPIYIGWAHGTIPATKPDLGNLDMRETFVQVRELFLNERGTAVAGAPYEILAYLKEQTLHERKVDGTVALNEFTDLIYKHLGKQYRPLTLN